MRCRVIVLLIFFVGCTGSENTGTDIQPADGQADEGMGTDAGWDDDSTAVDVAEDLGLDVEPDSEPDVCGTGGSVLSAGLVELSWDDGEPVAHIGGQDWSTTTNGQTYVLSEEPLWEAVRFEIEQPVRIHGFSVRWAGLPEDGDPAMEIEAGLYPDFGYNGFDFWQWDPYWTGTRCLEEAASGEWVDYVLDAPVEVRQPGLVYVAHRREGEGSPAFLFDGSTEAEGECGQWDACHSSFNLPEVPADFSYNGVSIQLPYDFLVRLWVELLEEPDEADHVFRPVEGAVGLRIAWGDYDGDGWDDYVTSGPRLWRNEGDGTFAETTADSGIAALGIPGGGGVWGDYDNDGCLDLFVFAESVTASDTLLRSRCDGTFEDVTAEAGIVDEQDYDDCGQADGVRSPSPAAAWVDLDADGLLDLYVANCICWDTYTYYTDTVFHNEGGGSFAEWTGTRGFSSARTASRGVSPVDYDGDGDVDLLINNYVHQANLFFENTGDGTVVERAEELGLAGIPDRVGTVKYGHTIGAAWGDLDNDGDFDVVQANLAHPRFYHFSDKTQVLINDGRGHYADASGDWSQPRSDAGLRYQETHSSPVLADFDQDGNLDLVITAVYDGRPTDFYWGRGDGTFELDVLRAGITTENGWGAAVADFDHDGDMDLAASGLFENTAGAEGHWLQVRVVGNQGSNRAAVGATVVAELGDRSLMRHVQGGTGQGCQDSSTLHFGLGAATVVDAIRVIFPGDRVVRFDGPFDADQRLWLSEDGTTHAGWAPP